MSTRPQADELVRAVAARHRITPDRIRSLPVGEANHVLALGPDLVLRVPRLREHAQDLAKEAELLPLTHTARVGTPALVEHATTPVPYLLQTRLPGTDLATTPTPAPALLRELGQRMGRLHHLPTANLRTPPRQGESTDPADLLQHLHHIGMLDAHTTTWCTSLLRRLNDAHPRPGTVLIHGDLTPTNLLATPDGALSGIVDLGDAALAEAAVDFAKLPPHWLPEVLAGYPHPPRTEHAWRSRILLHHLTWALARLREPHPRPGRRHWSAPPTSRLLALMRLLSTHPHWAPT
ncbi:aminoglycoside phosphotransferase family protein [Nocardiopsis sp. NPDC006832]|uniref:aminoglycoside phosphotransferase family protein n=1 Tax=Nocardiopsis sp. NPDC006832 TaxID=3157188 RepID=UPI0033EC6F24